LLHQVIFEPSGFTNS